METSKKNSGGKVPLSARIISVLLTLLVLWFPYSVSAQKDKNKTRQDTNKVEAVDSLFTDPVDSLQTKYDTDSAKIEHDSAAGKLLGFLKESGLEIEKRNIAEYRDDTISTKQDAIIEEIRRLTLESENYLKKGLDTTGLNTELSQLENWYNLTGDGVFVNVGSIQTHRNLETSYQILRELLTRTLARKSSLDDYYKNLVDYRNRIDSLYQENVLYQFSSDSVVALRYISKLLIVGQEIKPIDTAFKVTISTVAELQTTVNKFVNTLNTSIDQIQTFQKELSAKTFNRELANFGGPVKSHRPFKEIVHFSTVKGALVFVFYTTNQVGKILLLLGLFIACTIFLVKLKRNLRAKNLLHSEPRTEPVLKYPALSSVVISLNVFQFIFPDPPFIFIALLWTISSIAATIIFRNSVTRYWMFAWMTMFILFLFACVVNLLLQASRPERWMMFVLSIAGILAGAIIIMKGRRQELREKVVVYFIGFVVVLQITSLIFNMYGRYNLAKNCLTSGFFNVIVAMLFFWTIRFINDALFLATKAYRVKGKKLFNINFDRVGGKAPALFYVLLVFGWFVLFARNFYAHKIISGPVKDFIYDKRTIGEFTFSIDSLLAFFLILYLTGFVARLVSFFGADKSVEEDGIPQKGGMGSRLLLIRITIITIGFLLSLAAIGIPMDRLTIVLGALGVGVGFGLQTLVNNLVSGLIISFEKPVNVGDFVEVGGRSGVIKSIGFRSSIISTPDGSDVVVPNGDMLNEHLVNWTRDNSTRCVNILAGVAHGADLEKAIQLLRDLPKKDDRILLTPEPDVIIKDFKVKSIDLELSFWVQNIKEWAKVKSDIILAMDDTLRGNGIGIPTSEERLV